jgi:hypothetical protein
MRRFDSGNDLVSHAMKVRGQYLDLLDGGAQDPSTQGSRQPSPRLRSGKAPSSRHSDASGAAHRDGTRRMDAGARGCGDAGRLRGSLHWWVAGQVGLDFG